MRNFQDEHLSRDTYVRPLSGDMGRCRKIRYRAMVKMRSLQNCGSQPDIIFIPVRKTIQKGKSFGYKIKYVRHGMYVHMYICICKSLSLTFDMKVWRHSCVIIAKIFYLLKHIISQRKMIIEKTIFIRSRLMIIGKFYIREYQIHLSDFGRNLKPWPFNRLPKTPHWVCVLSYINLHRLYSFKSTLLKTYERCV